MGGYTRIAPQTSVSRIAFSWQRDERPALSVLGSPDFRNRR